MNLLRAASNLIRCLMNYLWMLLGALLGFVLLVFFRFLSIRWGFKDRNYGRVQRLEKQEIAYKASTSFLRGSQLVDNDLEDLLADPPPREARPRPFQTRAEIRRSFLVDILLDKPRWSDDWRPRN